jgi:hypothetical protein
MQDRFECLLPTINVKKRRVSPPVSWVSSVAPLLGSSLGFDFGFNSGVSSSIGFCGGVNGFIRGSIGSHFRFNSGVHSVTSMVISLGQNRGQSQQTASNQHHQFFHYFLSIKIPREEPPGTRTPLKKIVSSLWQVCKSLYLSATYQLVYVSPPIADLFQLIGSDGDHFLANALAVRFFIK